jgi:hypothetical protein
MPGKRANYHRNHTAYKEWKERSRMARASDVVAITSQEMWRRDCLKQRIDDHRITEKNKLEMVALRMPGAAEAAKYPGLDR